MIANKKMENQNKATAEQFSKVEERFLSSMTIGVRLKQTKMRCT